MSEARNVLDLFATLNAADLAALQREVQQLRAIKAWAQAHACDFTVGDTVVIADGFTVKPGGWWPYREVLVPGARATVLEINFSAHHGAWLASIVLEREWSVHERSDGAIRFWSGTATDTPDGHEPPTAYDQEHYPEGRKHTFMLGVHWLRPAPQVHNTWCPGDYPAHTASDQPCPRPM